MPAPARRQAAATNNTEPIPMPRHGRDVDDRPGHQRPTIIPGPPPLKADSADPAVAGTVSASSARAAEPAAEAPTA